MNNVTHFERLIETVGMVGNQLSGMKTLNHGKENYTGPELIDRFIKPCHQFVFFPWNGYEEIVPATEEEPVDLPFPVISIELIGKHITWIEDEERKKPTRRLDCLIAKEVGPKEYIFLMYLTDYPKRTIMTIERSTNFEAWNKMNFILAEYLNRMSMGKVGIESSGKKIRVGSGKNKESFKVKPVTHIYPAKAVHLATPTLGDKVIIWQHRWEVMGHWRKHNGLGKDREGNYNTTGFTWVKSHLKGPESAPVVHKTRIVH